MNEETILQYSKDLTLNYLSKINAEVEEHEGVYHVVLPQKQVRLFGNKTKRITFSPDIAATHSYELVVPGSSFLSIVLRETQKQAPVVIGIIPKNELEMQESLKNIVSKNCNVDFDVKEEHEKIGVRFYFHVNLKSIKNSSSIRWTDVEVDSLELLELPFNLNFKEIPYSDLTTEIIANDKKFDNAYSKAVESFENEMKPLVEKYVHLSDQTKESEIKILEAQERKKLQEIKLDLKNEKLKLSEFDRKISRAKSSQTQLKYMEQQEQFKKRFQKTEMQTTDLIQKIIDDKKIILDNLDQKYRPNLEISLLAAQVYSYNVSECLITLQKNNTHKQITGKYVDPTSSFITHCEVCLKNNETIHLCSNSHISCEECTNTCVNCKDDYCLNCKDELNPCYVCQDGLCKNCSKKCEFCSKNTCFAHSMVCTHCSKFSCYFCADECEFCSKRFCNESVNPCHSCNILACNDDSGICAVCSKTFCLNHQKICAICSKIHCNQDATNCEICHCAYSSDCVSGNQCHTCRNLKIVPREHAQIKTLIEKYPKYNKEKKWEFGENNQYLIFKIKKFFGSKTIVVKKETLDILRED